MDLLGNILSGFQTALQPEALMFCLFGVVIGTAVGVLPGFGPLAAISLLLPLTYYLEPTTGLIMLAGIFYGSQYGGSITSILLNVPGEGTSAVTCLDGYPMSRNGKAGIALTITAIASFVGASIGIAAMMLFSPAIAAASLAFSSVEYFSLMLVALVAVATLSVGSPLKGLIMVVAGLVLGLVGMDVTTATQRLTFNQLSLIDGLSLSAIAMGLFGVGEMLASIGQEKVFRIDPKSINLRSLLPSRAELRASLLPSLRGSSVGVLTGALPGAGIALSSFTAYSIEQKVAKDPSRFGNGAIEGIAAPEAANNAAVQAAFIPTMSLGIPGGPTMAIMLGALMVHNLVPSPTFITEHADLFWGLVASFWVGNVLLLVLNIPLIGIWVRLLTVPYHLLYPTIIAAICVGSYSVSSNIADVYLVLVFGVVGYVLSRFGYPAVPLLLGFILGPIVEENLRRALLISDGDFGVFVTRPLSATLMVVAAALLFFALRSAVKAPSGSITRESEC